MQPAHFTNEANHDGGDRADAVKLVMPSGSLAITKGTLWHRGGANRSDRPRLIITPQHRVGWVRQLENMALAVPAEMASQLPECARELIGYSIHPPFMGYVDGVHPRRLLRCKTPVGRVEQLLRNPSLLLAGYVIGFAALYPILRIVIPRRSRISRRPRFRFEHDAL